MTRITPIAKIISHCSYAHEPEWFTTAPSKAVPKALAKANLESSNIDYWELNQAFSVVGCKLTPAASSIAAPVQAACAAGLSTPTISPSHQRPPQAADGTSPSALTSEGPSPSALAAPPEKVEKRCLFLLMPANTSLLGHAVHRWTHVRVPAPPGEAHGWVRRHSRVPTILSHAFFGATPTVYVAAKRPWRAPREERAAARAAAGGTAPSAAP